MRAAVLLFSLLICASSYAQKTFHKKSTKNEKCEQQANYKEIIATADKAFYDEDFLTALNLYNKALALCPDALYVKDKVKETQKILDQQTYHDEELQYSKIIEAADKALAEENYVKAREYYKRALQLKPNDPYPLQKLVEIEVIMSQAAQIKSETDQKYDAIIDSAQVLFLHAEYQKAIGYYEQALTLKPNEIFPKNKITEANALIAAHQSEVETNYNNSILVADEMFRKKDYSSALEYYQLAEYWKPGETYPKIKIKEIETLLNAQKKN